MPKAHPVKVELAKRGQTQRWLAKEVRVSPGSLSHALNGRVAPWPSLKARIALVLGEPVDELFPPEPTL